MGTYEQQVVPIKIAHLAEYVSRTKHISLDDALMYIYINPLYDNLYSEDSKWWYLSTEALYKEFESRRQEQERTMSVPAFEFYAYCLENYAILKNIGGMKAWVLFKETGADKYIANNYDLLHTQGVEYIIEDIDRFISKRKK